MIRRTRLVFTLALMVLATIVTSGCAASHPVDFKQRSERGYIYYLDGSGGGNSVSNWGAGVRQGMRDAGYDGYGEMFYWQTGLGVAADHSSPVEFKRQRGVQLAQRILAFHRENPDTPITLMGLSAGNAVLLFALEALPDKPIIDEIVLLSSSVSSDYDLSAALRRVSGQCYVFTSQRDTVLLLLVPVGGTADRRSGAVGTMGIEGAKMPPGAAAEQYAKITEIPWTPTFGRLGNAGGHTDSVAAGFVREVVAPLIMTTSTKAVAATRSQSGLVVNPDYTRWARFEPGSSITIKAQQTINGTSTPVTLKATLVAKNEDRVVVDRVFSSDFGGTMGTPGPRRLFVPARIKPAEHPLTNPQALITPLERKEFRVRGRTIVAEGRSVTSPGHSETWGDDASGSVYTSSEVPGGLLRIEIQTTLAGTSGTFVGELVDFKAVR